MHKNLNFEGFWKCVQINFFHLVCWCSYKTSFNFSTTDFSYKHMFSGEQNKQMVWKREPRWLLGSCSRTEDVQGWSTEGSGAVPIPLTGRDTSDSTMRRICHRVVLPLWGRCDHVCVPQHSRSRGSQREAVDSLPACGLSQLIHESGTPNPFQHIYCMLDGRRPFWR